MTEPPVRTPTLRIEAFELILINLQMHSDVTLWCLQITLQRNLPFLQKKGNLYCIVEHIYSVGGEATWVNLAQTETRASPSRCWCVLWRTGM